MNIGAVLAGFVLILILSVATDTLLENTGIFPTIEEQKKVGFNVLWMNILAISYRFVYGVLGGYCTARLSISRPMRNVVVLGLVGTVVAIIGNVVVSQIPEMANILPLWFSIALVIIAFPSVWLGAKIQQIQNRQLDKIN